MKMRPYAYLILFLVAVLVLSTRSWSVPEKFSNEVFLLATSQYALFTAAALGVLVWMVYEGRLSIAQASIVIAAVSGLLTLGIYAVLESNWGYGVVGLLAQLFLAPVWLADSLLGLDGEAHTPGVGYIDLVSGLGLQILAMTLVGLRAWDWARRRPGSSWFG